MHMMFNLIKRPDKNQRMVIMSSCVAFAKLTQGQRVENELLPQMWEQVQSSDVYIIPNTMYVYVHACVKGVACIMHSSHTYVCICSLAYMNTW